MSEECRRWSILTEQEERLFLYMIEQMKEKKQ